MLDAAMDPFKGGKAWISGKGQKAWDTVNKQRKWPKIFCPFIFIIFFLLQRPQIQNPKKGEERRWKKMKIIRAHEVRGVMWLTL